jgi:hypothetical protein
MMERRFGFAALIAADHAQALALRGVVDNIVKLGAVTIRRIRGDFSNPCIRPWLDRIQPHPRQPVQGFPGAPGKNVSDIILIIRCHGPAALPRAGWAMHRVK